MNQTSAKKRLFFLLQRLPEERPHFVAALLADQVDRLVGQLTVNQWTLPKAWVIRFDGQGQTRAKPARKVSGRVRRDRFELPSDQSSYGWQVIDTVDQPHPVQREHVIYHSSGKLNSTGDAPRHGRHEQREADNCV